MNSLTTNVAIGGASLARAVQAMIRRPATTAKAMALDSAFIFSLGMIAEIFGGRIIDTLLGIGSLLIPSASISTDAGQAAISSGDFQSLAIRAIILVILMAISALVLFCLLEGSAWHASYSLAGKTMGWTQTTAAFTRISASLFPAYLVYESLGFLRDFVELSAERMPGLTIWNPSLIVPILGVVLAFLASVAFSSMDHGSVKAAFRNTWSTAILGIGGTSLKMIPFLLVIAILEVISRIAFPLGTPARAAGLILLLFTATALRTGWIIALDKPKNSDLLGGTHG